MINAGRILLVDRLPVLMYHSIVDPPTGGRDQAGTAFYQVNPAQFSVHLELIASMGFQPITFKTLASGNMLPERPIIITFDDGFDDNFHRALPLLNEFGFKGVFFVVSGNVDSPGWLKAGQVRELACSGMEIGSHGVTHRYLSSLPHSALLDELLISKEHLESITGQPVLSLALPGGRGSQTVGSTAKQLGYDFVAGSQPGNNAGVLDYYNVQRWAMTKQTSTQKLRQMLSGQPRLLATARRKYWLGATLKSSLGDHLYSKAWHFAAAVRLRLTG